CDDVVNGVASHHDEVPHTNVLGILVSAADAISASRPGARSETLTTYIKRLENLEKLGRSFPGVDRCFAVQAGRELRVMVQEEQKPPGKLNRNASHRITSRRWPHRLPSVHLVSNRKECWRRSDWVRRLEFGLWQLDDPND